MMTARVVISPGAVYGKWTVLGNGSRWSRLACVCQCGTVREVDRGSLRSGTSTNCGCVRKETCRAVASTLALTHGMYGTKAYDARSSMLDRCHNVKSTHWAAYGGAGVVVCQRWRDSFEAFLEDMGEPPTPGHSLDRYPDPFGNYEPGNCRWATRKEQQRNRRRNIRLTYKGESLTAAEWSERTGLPYGAIVQRVYKGWDDRRIIETPLQVKRKER